MEENYLHSLTADVVPFGKTLALRVAAKLEEQFSLAYRHRDYCGMGLEYHDGKYYYGELWDGSLDQDQAVVYTSRETFVSWLALQSTATMARPDDEDTFYRGNQVITRQRLQDFLEEKKGALD